MDENVKALRRVHAVCSTAYGILMRMLADISSEHAYVSNALNEVDKLWTEMAVNVRRDDGLTVHQAISRSNTEGDKTALDDISRDYIDHESSMHTMMHTAREILAQRKAQLEALHALADERREMMSDMLSPVWTMKSSTIDGRNTYDDFIADLCEYVKTGEYAFRDYPEDKLEFDDGIVMDEIHAGMESLTSRDSVELNREREKLAEMRNDVRRREDMLHQREAFLKNAFESALGYYMYGAESSGQQCIRS